MADNLKSITCFDIWVLLAIVFLSVGNIATPSNAVSVADTLSLITSGLFIIGIIIFLIFCSRLKKYRYLLIYDNCTKVPPTLKDILLVLLVIAGILVFYTQFDFVKSAIIYISVAVILSVRHIDSEDKI